MKVTASSILKLGIDMIWIRNLLVHQLNGLQTKREIHLEQAVGNLDVEGTAVL